MHAVKTVTMGEGGVVTTNDPRGAAAMARGRNHGMERDPAQLTDKELSFDDLGKVRPWVYEMAEPGYNYRATDIQCALGLSQLKKLDRFVARRSDLVARYRQRIARLAPNVVPVTQARHGIPAWHLFVVLIDFSAISKPRAQVMRELSAQGIGTQVHYIPVHRQPYYRAIEPGLSLPGAEAYYARALSLPLFIGMEDAEVDRVVDSLAQVLGI
jgi:dTDP-4-amino-4,6-dideoxygalactose transaminase